MAKKDVTYAEAVNEIEKILQELESGDPDVDELEQKVKRVTYLIKLCKAKLQSTEKSVNKILEEDLDEPRRRIKPYSTATFRSKSNSKDPSR